MAYSILTTSTEPVAVRARKDAAVKFGDSLGEPYRVVIDSGKVVHTFGFDNTELTPVPLEEALAPYAVQAARRRTEDKRAARQEREDTTATEEITTEPGVTHLEGPNAKDKLNLGARIASSMGLKATVDGGRRNATLTVTGSDASSAKFGKVFDKTMAKLGKATLPADRHARRDFIKNFGA